MLPNPYPLSHSNSGRQCWNSCLVGTLEGNITLEALQGQTKPPEAVARHKLEKEDYIGKPGMYLFTSQVLPISNEKMLKGALVHHDFFLLVSENCAAAGDRDRTVCWDSPLVARYVGRVGTQPLKVSFSCIPFKISQMSQYFYFNVLQNNRHS